MHDSPVRPTVAVLLPGSGSDHVFVAAAFAEPLGALGIRLLAPAPAAGPDVVSGLWRALDSAAGPGALVGGISFGAHLAARWAAGNPDRCAGLLLAIPGWVGQPAGAAEPPSGGPGQPATASSGAAAHGAAATHGAAAAAAALASAAAVRRHGVGASLAAIRAAEPAPWVVDELERAWNGYGDALADSLHAGALTPAPTVAELRRLAVPTGIAALSDDPLHPHAVAVRWSDAIPRASLVTISLAALGRDRAALGRAAVLGWLRASFGAGGQAPG